MTEYGDEVTEAEREAIDAILPYDELEELYNPRSAIRSNGVPSIPLQRN